MFHNNGLAHNSVGINVLDYSVSRRSYVHRCFGSVIDALMKPPIFHYFGEYGNRTRKRLRNRTFDGSFEQLCFRNVLRGSRFGFGLVRRKRYSRRVGVILHQVHIVRSFSAAKFEICNADNTRKQNHNCDINSSAAQKRKKRTAFFSVKIRHIFLRFVLFEKSFPLRSFFIQSVKKRQKYMANMHNAVTHNSYIFYRVGIDKK